MKETRELEPTTNSPRVLQAFRLRTRIETSTLAKAGAMHWRLTDLPERSFCRKKGVLHGDQHPARTLKWILASCHWLGDGFRMPQLTSEPITAEQSQLSKLSVSIRGKLQFMDYLVRAALADAQRYQDESDQGTRIFIRQLVEMHTANLRLESQNMRVVGELCNLLESMVDSSHDLPARGDLP